MEEEMSKVLSILTPHLGSGALTIVTTAVYLLDEALIAQFLPINGKPLALATMWALVFLYEKGVKDAKCQQGRHKEILALHEKTMQCLEGSRVIQDVNALYTRFKASGDSEITNEYSIIELARLVDAKDKLGLKDSYTQARLEYLLTKIKRD